VFHAKAPRPEDEFKNLAPFVCGNENFAAKRKNISLTTWRLCLKQILLNRMVCQRMKVLTTSHDPGLGEFHIHFLKP